MHISHPVFEDAPAGNNTDVPHRRRKLRTGVVKAGVTVIGIIGAVVTLCHNLGCF